MIHGAPGSLVGNNSVLRTHCLTFGRFAARRSYRKAFSP
ncbi:hypothetical protein NY08_3226 [Rhodococcus sp. B7740]|nr:hypothetical protein NY08_3226 [Rhodococcus sp. B7740]